MFKKLTHPRKVKGDDVTQVVFFLSLSSKVVFLSGLDPSLEGLLLDGSTARKRKRKRSAGPVHRRARVLRALSVRGAERRTPSSWKILFLNDEQELSVNVCHPSFHHVGSRSRNLFLPGSCAFLSTVTRPTTPLPILPMPHWPSHHSSGKPQSIFSADRLGGNCVFSQTTVRLWIFFHLPSSRHSIPIDDQHLANAQSQMFHSNSHFNSHAMAA